MTRAAQDGLRKYAAELAVNLAGQRIRSRMNPGIEEKLVNGFLDDLHSAGQNGGTPRAAN